ncbi:MAG: hypothetical protein WA705_01405 [Candidatus Ozemobacteraceae bacterium]
MTEVERNTRKCPFCAEIILAEAIKCRYCQTMLVDEEGKQLSLPVSGNFSTTAMGSSPPLAPISPSIWRLLLWNLLCPGVGAIKLGHRARGWLILGAMIVFMTFWSLDVMKIVNQSITIAMNTGNVNQVQKSMEGMQSGIWYDAMIYLYIYSFIDLLYIFPWKNSKST